MGGTFCLYLTCYVPPAGIKPFIKELIGGTPRCLFERNVPPKRRNCFQEGILVVHSRLKQESLYHRHKEEPWRGQWGRRNVQQAGWGTPQVRRPGCSARALEPFTAPASVSGVRGRTKSLLQKRRGLVPSHVTPQTNFSLAERWSYRRHKGLI